MHLAGWLTDWIRQTNYMMNRLSWKTLVEQMVKKFPPSMEPITLLLLNNILSQNMMNAENTVLLYLHGA